MAYEKGFYVTQDFAVGIQSINRANANNAQLFATMTAKHSNGVNGVTAPGITTQFGRHNDILVARSVARFVVQADSGGNYYLQPAAGMAGALTSSYVPARLGTGLWRVYVQTVEIYGAIACPVSSAAADYKAACRVVTNTDGSGYVEVSTWDVSTVGRVDIDFSLVVWTND